MKESLLWGSIAAWTAFVLYCYWDQIKLKNFIKTIFKNEIKNGEKFLIEFNHFKTHLKAGKKFNSELNFPSFLFYRDLVDEIFALEKSHGANLQEVLLEVKKSLMDDIKFLRQKLDLIQGAYLQMLGMSMIVFGYVFSCEFIMEIKVHPAIYVGIFIWQGCGIILFSTILKKRERKYFAPFSLWYLLLYQTRLLMSSHMDTQVFFRTHSEKVIAIRSLEGQKSWEFERLTYLAVLNHCRDLGVRGHEELKDLTQHLYEKRLFFLDKLQREMSFLKFFILTFFFLSTFLGFVLYLFSFFMD